MPPIITPLVCGVVYGRFGVGSAAFITICQGHQAKWGRGVGKIQQILSILKTVYYWVNLKVVKGRGEYGGNL